MADTFLQLTETPNSYNLAANKFVRVNNAADGIQFWNVTVPDLEDVDALGAYAPSTGDVLTYFSDNKWKPASPDIYSAGNGLNKVNLGFNVQAGSGGGLVANANGVYISDIANVAGTYGNASTATTFVVNDKGQITSVTESTIVATQAETITNDFVGNVIGTAGQINVTGGTGNNSNATLNLVATGVTAATYGNATTVPQITVDSYGRIQNVDLVTMSGGGGGSSSNVELAYKTIQVAGQTDLSADQAEDILTFVAGSGISITTNPGADSLTLSASSSAILGAGSVNDLGDIDTTSVADGQALLWNTANSAFEPGTVAAELGNSGVTAGTYGSTGNILAVTVDEKGIVTNVTETPFIQGDIQSVVAGTGLEGGGTSGAVTLDLEQTGVTPGTYGDSGNIAQFTVDVLGRISSVSEQAIELTDTGVTTGTYGTATSIPQVTVDAKGRITSITSLNVTDHVQSLSWNLANTTLTIGGGNSVDLSGLLDNVTTDLTTSSVADLQDIDTLSGIADGQALLWSATNSRFEYGNVSAGSASDAYKTISVSGQSDVVATGEDTLTLVASGGTTITTDAGTNTVTISSTASSGGGLDFGTFTTPLLGTVDFGGF